MPSPRVPLVDAYLTHLTVERRLAANSVESYARDLVLLREFAAGHRTPVERLTRQRLEELVRELMSQGRSPRSVARAIACYRGFYRFLVIDGQLKTNPADELRAPRAWKCEACSTSGSIALSGSPQRVKCV